MTAFSPALPGADAHRRAWTFAAIGVVLALAAVAPLFRREIVQAVRVWIDSPTYNHCFLILPIVLYLIWNRRYALADVMPRPAPLGLAAIVALSALWMIAAKLDILEARQLLFIAIVQAILFTVIGASAYRRLLGPLLYLFFLVPSGAFLVPKLQDITAHFTVSGLQLVGVPVYFDGNLIEIPEGSFVVAEACAGLRFLVASIAYGAVFALLVYTSWWRRAGFMALSVVVPVIANGMRAFGIVYAAHVVGSAQAVEADHILYGWVFFSIVIFLLTLLGMSFAQRDPLQVAAPSGSAAGDVAPPVAIQSSAVVLAILFAVAAPAFLLVMRGSPQAMAAAVVDFPQPAAAPWQRVAADPQWRPAATGPERELFDSFSDGQDTVERYVALYASHGDDNILRSLGRNNGTNWEIANSRTMTVRIGERDYVVDASEIRSNGRTRLVWSFYIVDGRVVPGTLQAKLLEAYADVFGRGRTAAFVAVSTPWHDGASASGVLTKFFAGTPALDGYAAAFR